MLFNSAVFILLFLLVYLLYWHIPLKGKHTLIILASFVFYAWFSLPFLLFFLFLIAVNYRISLILLQKKSRFWLTFALVLDIGSLAFFKYFYLFAEGIGYAVQAATGSDYLVHLRENWRNDHNFEILLPIAISFYTFQIVAWVVDSYRGTIQEKVPFKKFCVFILFFPQFVAGPIMRAQDFIPQIDNPTPTRDRILNGSLLLIAGVFKKVLIADQIGAISRDAWIHPEKYDATVLVLMLPAFIVRIYCDFSGYTDMARGLAKLLGYEIPENFRAPFLTYSMSELWQKWHITLSTWLRDYIYIPLGGSRLGELRTYRNILLTMALAGLWHGASWTMILWGIFMGLVLAWERFFRVRGMQLLPNASWANGLRIARTFALFSASTLLFAAPDITRSLRILEGIFTLQRGLPLTALETMLGLSIIGFLFNIPQRSSAIKDFLNARPRLRYVAATGLTFLAGFLVNLYGNASGSFIYFNF